MINFSEAKTAAALAAVTAVLKSDSHRSLLDRLNGVTGDSRRLREGDQVTILAGIPELCSGEINGEQREWLAFKSLVTRGTAKIEVYLGLNTLARGYYAESDEDLILVSDKTHKSYPNPQKLCKRFGDKVVLCTTTNEGITIPYIADNVVVKMTSKEGYRPTFDNGEWIAGDKTTVVVAE